MKELIPSRRDFLKVSAAIAAAAPFITGRASAAGNSDKLKIGLVGCGGRGTGAAQQALKADSNVVLTAMADAFSDRLQSSLKGLKESKEFGDKVQVDPDHCFVGLDAYQKLIDCGVDVVLLASPPGFRPAHLKAAVAAGKHIFCEKPMATDAPGVRSVLASVEAAKQKNLSIVAGFCWRYDYARREFFKLVHEGAIGDIRSLYGTYYTGPVKPMVADSERRPGMGDLEWQMRNWYNFVWLCGDGLVEQAVHTIDKMAWAMKDVMPSRCVAVGGRQIPNYSGNIYDHIEVNYEYADGTRCFVGQRQIAGCFNKTADYIMGTKGVGTIGERAQPEIKGEKEWTYTGTKNNMYQTEHDELFAAIRAGKPINDGVRMATSTMMAIMGRMAAYTGNQVTYDEALNSKEVLVPENLDWNMPFPIAPMSMPGRTKFA